jgi:hypothetical protein
MKVNSLKYPPKFFCYLLEPFIEKSGDFFLHFGRIMAIQNLKKDLIAALLVFSIACFLAIHSHPKEKRLQWELQFQLPSPPRFIVFQLHFGGGERENCRVI